MKSFFVNIIKSILDPSCKGMTPTLKRGRASSSQGSNARAFPPERPEAVSGERAISPRRGRRLSRRAARRKKYLNILI